MVYDLIQELIVYGIHNKLITEDDEYVVRNQLMDIFQLDDWEDSDVTNANESIEAILNKLVDYACKNRIIQDTATSRDLFNTKLMGVFTPFPHEVNKIFQNNYSDSPSAATNWYYNFNKKINYIRSERIEKNLSWTYESEFGTLDITINRSKPEKDPRDIAMTKKQKALNYPKCQLCVENMGFSGHMTHPARQNLRPVKLNINNSDWFLQYSPYGYYNEHCILFNKKHTPMIIDSSVFKKLFDFIEQFPHYFIGSNADLPIVGGSILTHEHFQGGQYIFAMEKAPIEKSFSLKNYMNVDAGIVKWPMSVIRLSSENRDLLEKACAEVLGKWRKYTDESVEIYAETDNMPHNTITPIARMKDSKYECDLVLRNNRTTKERPLGIFHPNSALHHIKKENIGLIEVMGLAVLPARLAEELEILKNAMLSQSDLYKIEKIASHADWGNWILENHPEFNNDNAENIIRNEVGRVFEEVLRDSGVFKRTENGKKAFEKFIDTI